MHRKSRFTLVMMAVLLMVGMVSIQPAKPVQADLPTDLFFSEYIEGSGSNKAIEIYNGTGSLVDLSDYSLELYSNGAALPSQTVVLSGTLATGNVFVAAHPDATQAILAQADLLSNSVVNWNGDDTIALRKISTNLFVDVIGQIGYRPPSGYWGSNPVQTADRTLVRKANICAGDTNGSDAFNPVTEWDAYPTNTTAYIGSHTSSCGLDIFPERFIISEYVEGSSNNKAIELYNGTGAEINLQDYQIVLFTNGSTTPGNTLTWITETILNNGDAYVIVNSNASAPLLALADITSTITNYNGNDTLVLFEITPEGDVVQDSFGQRGNDPGTAWGTGDTSTLDHTLVRKASVCQGDILPDDAFEPSLEYIGFAQDTFTNLGSHSMACSGEDLAPTVASTLPTNSGTAQKTDNIVITFSEPVTVTDSWFSISCGTSGTHSAVVTDADPVFTLNPDADFAVGETCTVTIDHTKVNDDDTDDATADYMLADYAFSFTIAAGCGDAYTPIYDIQGTGAASPVVGQTVSTEGVVVGDFQVGGRNGYYIQEPNADADPLTSNGIFVYNTAVAVNVGDRVRVNGAISEWVTGTGGTLTELTPTSPASSNVLICSTGNTIAPTEVTLPVTAVSDFERYEGMLVTFPQSLIISEYFNFDRYGEIVLTSTRHMTPTAFVEPGTPAQAEAAAYLLDRITLDDGRTAQNPDPAIHPNGQIFNMSNLFRGGGTVTDATGILDFYQGLYRVQPTAGATYEDANPRTAAPEITEADLKVASFNVLNYFVTLDGGTSAWICGPSGDMECRGADNAEEFGRQRAKILAALGAIDADVFGLMEIENEHPDGGDAVADLVAGLNAINGEGTYAYIETGAIGGDAIKQAILYKPASVTPVGSYDILDSSVDARFIDTANRPVLAQVFRDNETDVEFVVAVNHLKSKGSPCTDDPDTGDGQGNCNLTRKAAAQALVDWLADPAYFPDVEKALIIGDLNSYDKEDPIEMIKLGPDDTADTGDDYLDMIFEKRGEYAYGYVYDGQTGYLDHALANQAMAESIVDVNFWHINADEPDLIDFDTSFKLPAQDALYAPDAYRSSDHDPVIITLSFIPLTVTNADLMQSTDLSIWTSVDGNLTDGYAINLNAAVEYYYLNAASITSNRPLANGSYPFFMAGNPGSAFFAYWAERGVVENATGWQGLMWQIINGDAPMFYLKVEGTSFNLIDGLQGAPNPLRVNGDYYPGLYTFSGLVEDEFGFEDELDVSIYFNDIPVAEDQAVTTPEETFINITLAATDIDGDELTYAIATEPTHGEVDLTGNIATYTPALNYFGEDSFTFKANDGLVDSAPATVTITVTNVKDQVEAVDDSYATNEDTALTIAAPGVLENDIDVDNNIQAASLVTDVQHGTLSLLGDGSFTYVPDPDFTGTDTFIYQLVTYLAPQSLWTDEATVTITVNPVDDAPVPGLIQDATIPELVEFSFTTTATDADVPAQVLTFSLVGAPEGAAITSAGVFTWTPTEAQGAGVYTFTVKVCDDTDPTPLCDEQEVTLTVTEVNAAPVAQDRSATTQEETPVVVTLVASDAENDTLIYAIVAQPAHGTVTLAGTTATYTPDLDYNGADSFTYKANDGLVDSNTATVTITVTPVNDAPSAEDDHYVTDEDVTLTVPAPGILGNDSDVDGDEMTIIPVADVTNGMLNWTLNGGFTYTPDPQFNGIDTFSYMLFDGDAYSNTEVVTITVTPVNDWPIANDDSYEVLTGTELVKDAVEGVLANDVLIDLDEEVSIQILEEPQHGTLSMNDDGSFTYIPNLGYMGTDTFRYMVLSVRTINAEWSDDATVTITVEPLMRLFLPTILR